MQEFKFHNVSNLNFDLSSASVEIVEGNSFNLEVNKDTDVVDIKFYQGTVYIQEKGNLNVGTSKCINNMSGSSSGATNIKVESLSIINGTVFIGGKSVSTKESNSPPLVIKITCPRNLRIEGNLSGTSRLDTNVVFEFINLNLSSSSVVTAESKAISLNTSGSSTALINSLEGSAYIRAAGSSYVKLKGVFKEVVACSSGSSSLRTHGNVSSFYEARSSSSSLIKHIGSVSCSVSKSSSGFSHIEGI